MSDTPARRPTPEDFPRLFDLMADELLSLRAACREMGLDPSSTSKAIKADEDLNAEYEMVREERGDGYGEKVNEIAAAMLGDKPYDPKAARVAMDGYKWTAARMKPKAWGDRIAHEHSGPDGGPMQYDDSTAGARIAALLAAAEARRAADEAE